MTTPTDRIRDAAKQIEHVVFRLGTPEFRAELSSEDESDIDRICDQLMADADELESLIPDEDDEDDDE